MFDKLLSNKSFKALFLNQFKEIVKQEGAKYIVLEIKEDGSFEPTIHKEEIKILSKAEYDKLINIVKSTL